MFGAVGSCAGCGTLRCAQHLIVRAHDCYPAFPSCLECVQSADIESQILAYTRNRAQEIERVRSALAKPAVEIYAYQAIPLLGTPELRTYEELGWRNRKHMLRRQAPISTDNPGLIADAHIVTEYDGGGWGGAREKPGWALTKDPDTGSAVLSIALGEHRSGNHERIPIALTCDHYNALPDPSELSWTTRVNDYTSRVTTALQAGGH